MNRIVFLGTGGGKHVMFSQVRRTGGMYFEFNDNKKNSLSFVMDPGPGSLVNARSAKIKAESVNGIVLSHYHIDHSTDANVWLDGLDNPFLIAEEHCIFSKEDLKEDYDYYPCITPYHLERLRNVHPVKHGSSVKVRGVEFRAVRCSHYGPAVGFVISYDKFKIGYTSDGTYYASQERHYEGCDILIMNVLVPKGEEAKELQHMSIYDAVKFIRAMKDKPKLVILQHFSLWMLRANLWKQCKILKDATGVPVVHADDFMQIDIDKVLQGIRENELYARNE
jgi:ribonuclease BN (tRNA processing enzyme)